MDNMTQMIEQVNQPLKYERDQAAVNLSIVIGELAAAQQTRCVTIVQLNEFKLNFTRLTNLTIADVRITNITYNKLKLVDVVNKILQTDTTISNIKQHCEVARKYLNALFSTGVLNI